MILLIVTVVIAIVALFLAIWALIRSSHPEIHHRTRIIHHHSDDDVPTPVPTPPPVEPDFDGLTDNLITATGTEPRFDITASGYRIQATGTQPLEPIPAAQYIDPTWEAYVVLISSTGVNSAEISLGLLKDRYGQQYNVYTDPLGPLDVTAAKILVGPPSVLPRYRHFAPVARYDADQVIFTVPAFSYHLP